MSGGLSICWEAPYYHCRTYREPILCYMLEAHSYIPFGNLRVNIPVILSSRLRERRRPGLAEVFKYVLLCAFKSKSKRCIRIDSTEAEEEDVMYRCIRSSAGGLRMRRRRRCMHL